jgi:hypothetical protein
MSPFLPPCPLDNPTCPASILHLISLNFGACASLVVADCCVSPPPHVVTVSNTPCHHCCRPGRTPFVIAVAIYVAHSVVGVAPFALAAVVVSDWGGVCFTWKSDAGCKGGRAEIWQLPEYMMRVAKPPLLLGRTFIAVIGARKGQEVKMVVLWWW